MEVTLPAATEGNGTKTSSKVKGLVSFARNWFKLIQKDSNQEMKVFVGTSWAEHKKLRV